MMLWIRPFNDRHMNISNIVSSEQLITEISSITDIPSTNITNVYMYGSRVYGTITNVSDYDFIVVNNIGITNKEYAIEDKNVHVYDIDQFQQMIHDHHIMALECINLPPMCIIKNDHTFDFALNKSTLRHRISAISSNSWVKSKKKLTLAHECNYVGMKSMFHSLRIIDFGIQIAKHGHIVDYQSSNTRWKAILTIGPDWDQLNETFKPIYNQLLTEFRKVAPKD